MPTFLIMNIVISQLLLYVKAGGSSISSLDMQTLLAFPLQPSTHPTGVLMLLSNMMLNLIGELSKNLRPLDHLARRLCLFIQLYQRCMVC